MDKQNIEHILSIMIKHILKCFVLFNKIIIMKRKNGHFTNEAGSKAALFLDLLRAKLQFIRDRDWWYSNLKT